jgi:cyclopropane fatty-acyl-phospholipid synthase-like methyltransferase
MLTSYNGSFYDADYFERGKLSGKGWLENYHWKPRRSFKEAFAFIDYFGLDENSRVLDFGCAKGFIVRALNELEIPTEGCDISDYALSFAPSNCWNCSDPLEWLSRGYYTHVISKDVFEHLTKSQLQDTLDYLSLVTDKIMCVVPMGDTGVYRIPEYHLEISHQIIENEVWWQNAFCDAGWYVVKDTNHVPGLKDNWMTTPYGNHVFVLEKI